jgi:hypothetical protein
MYVCQWQKKNGILVAVADGMSSFSALSFPITSKVLNWKPCEEEEEQTVQTRFPGTTRDAVSQSVSQSARRQLQQQKKMRPKERERERERERESCFSHFFAHIDLLLLALKLLPNLLLFSFHNLQLLDVEFLQQQQQHLLSVLSQIIATMLLPRTV